MSKAKTMQRVAEELRPEICLETGIPENEIREIQVEQHTGPPHWRVIVHAEDGRTITRDLAAALARHLASPPTPDCFGAGYQAPDTLLRHARIESALRYLGVFGFGIPVEREDLFRDWLYERKPRETACGGGQDDGSQVQTSLEPYSPGEIIRCAGWVALALCRETEYPGFPERLADFRGEEFKPKAAREYAEKWYRLSNWNPAKMTFQKFLSTACIGSERWLTFAQLKQRWNGLKTGLITAGATYCPVDRTEGSQLMIRPVPACKCPTCGGFGLARLDNTCSGQADGHVPHIRAYVYVLDGDGKYVLDSAVEPERRSERLFRFVPTNEWSAVDTWKCDGCGRYYFLPPGELLRQRATAILKMVNRELTIKQAAGTSKAITLVEMRKIKKRLRESSAEDRRRQIERWEAQRRLSAYPCPNCGTTDRWSPGATFWVKVADLNQRDGAQNFAGFVHPPDQFDEEETGEVDRRTLPDAEPDQVFERALDREAIRRLVARVQPGTAEYLFVRMNYPDDPPLDDQKQSDDPPLDIQTQFMMLTQAQRLHAMYRLQDLFRQIEAELEADDWQHEQSDEVPDTGSNQPMSRADAP
jgi:hypothetical protein